MIVYPDEWTNFTGDWPPWEPSVPAIKRVEVIWVDAKAYSNEWVSLEEIKEFRLETCSTGGYIVYEDAEAYYVAQTKGEQGFHNIFLIPKGCVRWIEYCTDGEE